MSLMAFIAVNKRDTMVHDANVLSLMVSIALFVGPLACHLCSVLVSVDS